MTDFFNTLDRGDVVTSILNVGYNRNSATDIQIETGIININNVEYTISVPFTTKTSGSDTLTASSLVHIYLTNDSGLKQHHEVWASTADDPVYDSDLDYYKHPTLGADYRWIGAFFTDGSSQIPTDLQTKTIGRDILCFPTQVVLFTNLSTSGTQSLAGTIPANSISYFSDVRVGSTSGAADRGMVIRDSSATGTLLMGSRSYADAAWGAGITVGSTGWNIKFSDTIYIQFDANSSADMRIRGWRARR